MKTEEKVSVLVRPEYYLEHDPEYIERYQVNKDHNLYFDITMKKLTRVEDVYKDLTTF